MREVHARLVRDVDLVRRIEVILDFLLALFVGQVDDSRLGRFVVINPAEVVLVTDCYAVGNCLSFIPFE